MLRITGFFHFIDAWSGETGYIKIIDDQKDNFQYVWTQSYDITKGKNGINICGSEYVEGQLSVQFDFSIPHLKNDVILAFGSTLQGDPFENSFGISNLQIWVR
ncbi:hypothetical protein IMG5_105530 [Ichthyophthirius multifiliis]|uniref:Uncharacterized protein n=1 Tax=Ichthyophthirius multifiliis TaxID=5932 RepID=G0QT23_ICHMU|nr:hypothetical protein IMG5_105530 [Ichthyophthirius multifiliis]EGR31640.1 hypothetical protein IMG5_105530 [Ichthyophthirius multifiliis]|eukprot:XP_004035126.1 hypothetical protein IMG5_105530 [Ichthyophthirius multifiliis]